MNIPEFGRLSYVHIIWVYVPSLHVCKNYYIASAGFTESHLKESKSLEKKRQMNGSADFCQ